MMATLALRGWLMPDESLSPGDKTVVAVFEIIAFALGWNGVDKTLSGSWVGVAELCACATVSYSGFKWPSIKPTLAPKVQLWIHRYRVWVLMLVIAATCLLIAVWVRRYYLDYWTIAAPTPLIKWPNSPPPKGIAYPVLPKPKPAPPQVDWTLVAKGLQEPPGAPFADGDNSKLLKEMTRLESMSVTQIRGYLAGNIERLRWFDHTKWHYPTQQSFDDVTIGPNGEDEPNSKKEYDRNMATMQHNEELRPLKRFDDFPKLFPKFSTLIQYLQEKFPDVPVPIECYPDSVRDKKLYEGVVSACADYLQKILDNKFPRPQ